MNNYNPEINENSSDYDVNVRIITFAIISIFLILLSIYFIRKYASKKQYVLQNMRLEAINIENAFSSEINYSKYVLNLITYQLKNNYDDINFIENTLKNYVKTSDFSSLFSWRKYSWINSNFKEIITNKEGKKLSKEEISFVKNVIAGNNWKNKIIFYVRKSADKNRCLNLVSNLADKYTNTNYIGSIVLSYNIEILIQRLYTVIRNNYTNFIIIDEENNIIAQSKPQIKNLINNEGDISLELKKILDQLDLKSNSSKELSYLDIISGTNHYIKKIKDLPFTLVVSLDSEEINNTILDSIIKKFVEVTAFALMFFLSVISIYRRETWLRAKAEQATIIANKATKAKSDFLAFTAHEIRSPLGFILTGSEIMTKKLFGELSMTYEEYAEGIHQNAKIILDFITDILDENQIIEGKFKIINSITDIKEIIYKSVTVNKIRFNNRKINIEIKLTDELPKLICDQRRILQVFNNLISNAIKYSNDDTTIIINGDVIADKLEIEVIDQGIGMSEAEIKVALSNYGIVQKEKYNFIDSYGLGLSIVKMLLEAHEAELIITSTPNVGTNVKIIFPKFKLIYT